MPPPGENAFPNQLKVNILNLNYYPMLPIMISGKEILSSQNKALFELLDPLKKEEAEALRTFLASPYFNEDKRITVLCRRLFEAYKGTGNRINGKPLLKAVLGNSDTEKGIPQLKQLMKKLEELLLEFFAHQELRHTGSHLRHRALVSSLKRRRNTARFREASRELSDQLDSEPESIMNLIDKWWLAHQNYFHQNSLTYKEDRRFFEKAFQYFNHFSEALILGYYLEYTNRNKFFSDDFQVPLLESFFQRIEQSAPTSPLGMVYLRLIHSLRNRQNPEAYRQLKSTYLQHKEYLAKVDTLIVVKLSKNICNYLYQQGQAGAEAEMFFWSREGVEEKVFLFEGVISDGEYLNVALSAAAAGAFEYQYNFMHAYRPYLESGHRDKAFHLAMAYFHFHQEKYRETTDLLENHFPKNAHEEFRYTLRVKTLMVRSYLLRFLRDWDCIEEYEREVDALRKFLNRKQFFQQEWQAAYFNFIQICNRLFYFRKNSVDKKASTLTSEKFELLKDLDGFEQVPCRQWLKNLIQKQHPWRST